MTKKAFTLFEIIVVLGIFAGIAAITFPITINQSTSARYDNTLSDMNSLIFTQQQYAFARRNNNSYGVYFYNNKYTLYTGTSLATATDTNIKNLTNGVIINSINLSGGANEINFASGSFRPNNSGNIKINFLGTVYTLEINAEGLIHYYKS